MKRTAMAVTFVLAAIAVSPAAAFHVGGPPSLPSASVVHCPAGYNMVTSVPAAPSPIPIPYPACVEPGVSSIPTMPSRCSSTKIPVWHRNERVWVCYP